MIKNLFLSAFLTALSSFWLGVAPAQAERDSVSAASSQLTPTQMQADFDLMRHALEEAHPGLYRYSTKAQMDHGFELERAKLGRSMSKPQFEAVLAETLALMRCGHTKMNTDEELESAIKNARTLPLRVVFEGRRVMVLFNDTPDDQTIRPGMEVVEINGRSVADIVSRFWPLISADGDIETGKRHDISSRFAQDYWWLIDQTAEFNVKAIDGAARTVIAKLVGVTDAERKAHQNPVNGPMNAGIGKLMGHLREDLSLRFLTDPQIAEIRIHYFLGENYPRWIEDTFKALSDKGTQTLIIDLRGNGGGEDMYGAMLVSYLTDKPFRYFDRIHVNTITPSFKEHTDWKPVREDQVREGLTPDPAGGYLVTARLHEGVAEQKPGKFPFAGKVFVLIDGGTFSTAADCCAVIHHLKRATFIGEETGGGYYGNNSGTMPTLTLPKSKVGIRLPMCGYWNAVPGYQGTRRGTIPDHVLELKTADVLRGVDGQLDFARKLASGGTTAK